MKRPQLTDVYQVTRIRYNTETTRVDMWTERSARHRKKLNFTHHDANKDHLIGGILGLKFVLNLMEMITGKCFIYDDKRDVYFREDIKEEEKNLDIPAEAEDAAHASI